MHRAELAEYIAIADRKLRGLALVFLVLRRRADRRELEDLIVLTYAAGSFDDGVRTHRGAGAKHHVGANHGERADAHALAQLRPWRNDGEWIDQDRAALTWTPREPPSCPRWPLRSCRQRRCWRSARCP